MTAWKAVAAATGVSGMAGGGYLMYPHLFPENKKTILDELRSRNKSPIDGNEHQWTLKKELYLKSPNNFKIVFKGSEKSNITEEELKEWCSTTLKESYSEEKSSVLLRVEKWCLKPNIREALSKESQELIPLSGSPIDTAWSSKITTHSNDIKKDLIDGWKLPEAAGEANKVKEESLRDACRQKIEKEYISNDDGDYIASKKWCLKPQ
ncbi:hypothetical protein HF1_08520 [Mycoplasma haemofelis str. Langford 1]|uniref:Uncharacterized protein n=2 Tax=Mycoplasma haemofelis TaxID=29501 RepID=F6FIZ1_MYCHI|nr:hypothetical protein [Mycoplasma haemofelis]AEG73189.1 hypothetical protein MHF_0932 [Mycoplasma haemofelis Ohio2]CBY92860.1 hypothetical protein HF1_08520 [Mycoplasma haemofelis str. Langford 1]